MSFTRLQGRSQQSGNNLLEADTLLMEQVPVIGIAVIELSKKPSNILDRETLEVLHRKLCEVESEKAKGLILTSTHPQVFSAGLDITEIYDKPVDSIRRFWTTVQDVWIKLYSTPYPTVAAINGHCPAGGCLLAVSCEHRIIVPKVNIGLNEVNVGIAAPFWLQDCMRNVIGERKAERSVLTGKLFTSEEALKIGLVDEIVNNVEELRKSSYEFIKEQIKLPASGREAAKATYRRPTLIKLLRSKEEDTEEFIKLISQPSVQENLKISLESLMKNKFA